MPTNAYDAQNPNIINLISEIQSEAASRVFNDRRHESRQTLVLPVTIQPANGVAIEALTRDISFSGIGLITRDPIDVEMDCTLYIDREQQDKSQVHAICQWCEPFGEHHWISGWRYHE